MDLDIVPAPADDRLAIVAADHPSLADGVGGFLTDADAEWRTTGRLGALAGAAAGRLLARLAEVGPGFRLAGTLDGRVVGLARVDHRGEVSVAVAADARGKGVGTSITSQLAARSRVLGYTRLVLHPARCTSAAVTFAASAGFVAVDLGGDRIDLVLRDVPVAAPA